VSIVFPVVVAASSTFAVMSGDDESPDDGPATGGQLDRQSVEQVDRPGVSAVSMYTVNPPLSTTTRPRDVSATLSESPDGTGVVLAAPPVASELVELPQPAATSVSRAAPPTMANWRECWAR
jgi:hypothetical protein